MDGASMWRRSLNACWAAPSPGCRYGTREDTCHRSDGCSREREDGEGGDDTQRYHDDAEQVEALAAILERSEETWSYLQTDGIDEENQSELLEEVEQMLIEIEREVTEDEADEKNPSQSQGNSLYSQLS